VNLFSLLILFSNNNPLEHVQAHEDVAMFLNALAKLVVIVSLVSSGVIIAGSLAMMKRTSYALSMAAAICGIIGGFLWVPIGWLFVMPFGIWAVVVLRKAECKRLFGQTA
jgi:hypothetical protein